MFTRRTIAFAAFALGLSPAARAQAEAGGGGSGAIDEGFFAPINGLEQWITIRGRDRRNPALVLLHGGPGFPMSFMAPVLAAWEEHFTLVQWDQPGGGATLARNAGREGPLTLERYVADGLAVVELIRQRLRAPKVALMGTSWGTALGVTMVQRRPDLFFAYVGAAQAVSGPQGHRLGYELGLKAARERGDGPAVAALEKVGPPPYARFEDFLVRQTYTNAPGLPPTPPQAAAEAALGRALAAPPAANARYVARGLPATDFMKAFMDTQRQTFRQTAEWEAKAQGMRFSVPVFVYQGARDLNTPASLAQAWVEAIEAPAKRFELLPDAGHNVFAFHDQLLAYLRRDVLPLAPRV